MGYSELIWLFWAKWNQNWVTLIKQNFPHHKLLLTALLLRVWVADDGKAFPKN